MSLLRRIIAAVTLALAAAGFTVNETGLPPSVERTAIIAGLMVLTPEMEGTVYAAYPDTGGVWTICTGHTKGVRRGDVATVEECAAYLRGDLGGAVDFVMREFPGATIWQKIALADFVYNLGAPALLKSTLFKLAKAGKWREAADQFPRWAYVAGLDCRIPANKCQGIPKRREMQRSLFLVGL